MDSRLYHVMMWGLLELRNVTRGLHNLIVKDFGTSRRKRYGIDGDSLRVLKRDPCGRFQEVLYLGIPFEGFPGPVELIKA